MHSFQLIIRREDVGLQTTVLLLVRDAVALTTGMVLVVVVNLGRHVLLEDRRRYLGGICGVLVHRAAEGIR
jgi:hypothetical protein